MRQNKYELRISILFIFKHCFMLSFSPYPILLITFNTMLVASSERIFFYVSPFAGFFFSDKFLLQEFRWEIVTPPPVISNGPSLSTDKISFSVVVVLVSESKALYCFGERIHWFNFVCGRNTRRKTDSSEKFFYKCGFKNIQEGTLRSNDATATRTSLKN